jgi:dynein heavy chain
LSAIISQAFEDCNSLNSIFKLITILGNLLERKTIKHDFEPRYVQIVEMLENEMDSTKKIYDEQKGLKLKEDRINVHRNMPEVSGGLKWCQELKDRVSKPMELFKKLIDHPITNSEQMERVNKKYKELLDLLNGFSNEIYKTWCSHVGKLSNNNLEKNLIVRDPKTKSIKTNFDPQV